MKASGGRQKKWRLSFKTMLFINLLKMSHCEVLLLRLEDATGREKLEIIENIMKDYSNQIIDCFCVFQNNKFRI